MEISKLPEHWKRGFSDFSVFHLCVCELSLCPVSFFTMKLIAEPIHSPEGIVESWNWWWLFQITLIVEFRVECLGELLHRRGEGRRFFRTFNSRYLRFLIMFRWFVLKCKGNMSHPLLTTNIIVVVDIIAMWDIS